MSSPSPATAVRTLSAVETPASSGLYPPGLNRVAMPPNAQIPRLVFMGRPYRAVLAWFTLGSSIWRAERPARATGGHRGEPLVQVTERARRGGRQSGLSECIASPKLNCTKEGKKGEEIR